MSKCDAKLCQNVPKRAKLEIIRIFYTVWQNLAQFSTLWHSLAQFCTVWHTQFLIVQYYFYRTIRHSLTQFSTFWTVINKRLIIFFHSYKFILCKTVYKNVPNCVKLRKTVQNSAQLCLVIQKNLIKLDSYK